MATILQLKKSKDDTHVFPQKLDYFVNNIDDIFYYTETLFNNLNEKDKNLFKKMGLKTEKPYKIQNKWSDKEDLENYIYLEMYLLE